MIGQMLECFAIILYLTVQEILESKDEFNVQASPL